MSIVRDNLLSRPHYSPYCGGEKCYLGLPRTHYIRGQFRCGCGWVSSFDEEFIKEYETYRATWVDTPIPRSEMF
ncbi:hypothetical protein EVB55_092 [Rhizobium phage RHph_Y68]|uniref:Uncharacterized protein n=1 Tax=Rhizobium phage RHph_Y68 TaxID=2509787 RepID=A0A7S5QXW3_9CAUD|nr:hypothetical protein PP934_gp092 [Rhizobium phage RHph_Y68]QIG68027.1 hypothetical protein EVB55_092 [Rhizobium phage RHph_Y68]